MRSLRPHATVALLAACALAPGALAASGKPISPKALHQALLKTALGPTAAPIDGYVAPRIGTVTPSPIAKRHHVVGEVKVLWDKQGTGGARVLYIVFPTHADALADWNEGAGKLPKQRLAPPGIVPKPSAMFNSSQTVPNPPGMPLVYGTTTLAFLTGNVIVEIDTSSTTNRTQGDILGTIALTQFALKRLADLGGPVTPVTPATPEAPAAPVA